MRRILVGFVLLFSTTAMAQNIDNQEFVTFTDYRVKKGETIYKIAQKFDLGFDEIIYSNPDLAASKFLQIGQKLNLPTTHLLPNVAREGIVINLAEPRLYFFKAGEIVDTFPISIGADEKTPTGKTQVAEKKRNPTWTPPASIREENPDLPEVVPAGPENPLGNFALKLDASKNVKWQSIMIHGTNVPTSIGSRVSHGCIRLYPWDIEKLFGLVEIATPVRIVNQQIKVNIVGNSVYLEAHLKEEDQENDYNAVVKRIICKRFPKCESEMNWDKVSQVIKQNNGIAVKVSN